MNSLTKEPLKKDKAQGVASEKPSEAEEQTYNIMVSETSLNCCPVNYICGTLHSSIFLEHCRKVCN